MEKYFALDMPAARFVRNTLVVSLLGMVPLLIVYVALTPGFGDMLLGGGPALGRFLRQVLTNGLPVVFAVNYLGFFLFALLVARKGPDRGLRLVLLIDLPARVVLFALLHAMIYVLSADWFGSFGGSRLTALRVVAPTLARSALFENLSGVYLYATLLGALPLYLRALQGLTVFRRARSRALARWGPVLLALMIFALFVLALTTVMAAIARWQIS